MIIPMGFFLYTMTGMQKRTKNKDKLCSISCIFVLKIQIFTNDN